MDPLASKSLIRPIKEVKLMVAGAENGYLAGIIDLFKQATQEAERKEREAAEKERR